MSRPEDRSQPFSPQALAFAVREIVDHVDEEGWDLPPQLFALVPTQTLQELGVLGREGWEEGPESYADYGAEGGPIRPHGSPLTAVEQESLPDNIAGGSPELMDFVSRTSWPEGVLGCVLIQEVTVVPPEGAESIEAAVESAVLVDDDAELAAYTAAWGHERTRQARLITGVVHEGPGLTLLQIRPRDEEASPFGDGPDLRTHPQLAPEVEQALRATFTE